MSDRLRLGYLATQRTPPVGSTRVKHSILHGSKSLRKSSKLYCERHNIWSLGLSSYHLFLYHVAAQEACSTSACTSDNGHGLGSV